MPATVAQIGLSILWLVCACQGCPHQRRALRAGFCSAAPPLTVLAEPRDAALRNSRRELWPDGEKPSFGHQFQLARTTF
jgi:hypothetical protein